MLKIGNVELENPFIAAPLAGITDLAMRKLNKEMGASLVFSEMISGKGLIYNNKKTEYLLRIAEDEKPLAYQIFGSEPKIMAEVADMLNERDNAILDINIGCPVPKVVKNGEGSALLKSPALIYDIVKAIVEASKKPVTAKIRIGWDDKSLNYIKVAKILEQAGVEAITVHGRTRNQYYSGNANWDAIKEIKKEVAIPIIGNGDIFTGEDAMRMLEYTNCDMVMIARGMLGNPWIFRECKALYEGRVKPEPPTPEERVEVMTKHLQELILQKGEKVAVKEMRKHVAWYTKGMKHSATFRKDINSLTNSEEIIEKFKGLAYEY